MSDRYAPLRDRFWQKVARDESGCWEWLGSGGSGQYGRIRENNKQLLAHRVSYEMHRGPIPAEMTIDHLCCNKGCVNPAHLEVVTRGENVRRWAASVTVCPQGHPYDDVNTYVDSRGRRGCLTCRRRVSRNFRLRGDQ